MTGSSPASDEAAAACEGASDALVATSQTLSVESVEKLAAVATIAAVAEELADRVVNDEAEDSGSVIATPVAGAAEDQAHDDQIPAAATAPSVDEAVTEAA